MAGVNGVNGVNTSFAASTFRIWIYFEFNDFASSDFALRSAGYYASNKVSRNLAPHVSLLHWSFPHLLSTATSPVTFWPESPFLRGGPKRLRLGLLKSHMKTFWRNPWQRAASRAPCSQQARLVWPVQVTLWHYAQTMGVFPRSKDVIMLQVSTPWDSITQSQT